MFLLQHTKEMRQFWGRKSVCLITGASQNLGRALAEDVAKHMGNGSLVILTSRSSERLGVVRQAIYETNPCLSVQLLQWDLAHPDGYKCKEDLTALLKVANEQAEDFELAMVIHNAADPGDLSRRVVEFDDAALVQEHLNINLVSMVVVNSAFWSVFDKSREKVLINMKAQRERASLGLSAMSQAARSMALNVLADECPEIRVLHFCPGAVDTSLLKKIMRSTHSPQVHRNIQEMYEQNKVLQPKEAVRCLIEFLANNEIDSGMIVDASNLPPSS